MGNKGAGGMNIDIQSNLRMADAYGSGKNCPLFEGVPFSEPWSKFSIFKLFAFFFINRKNRLYLE